MNLDSINKGKNMFIPKTNPMQTQQSKKDFYNAAMIAALNPDHHDDEGGTDWFAIEDQVYDYLVTNDKYTDDDYKANIGWSRVNIINEEYIGRPKFK